MPTRFLNLTYGIVVALGAFLNWTLLHFTDMPAVLAALIALCACGVVGGSLHRAVFHPLQLRGAPSWRLLLLSIGVYILLQNLMSLAYGDNVKVLETGKVRMGWLVGTAYITAGQFLVICIATIAAIAHWVLLLRSRLGLMMRGVASNSELSEILGVNRSRTVLWSIVIASMLYGLTGVLASVNDEISHAIGFRYVVLGFVIMIVGGVGSRFGLIIAAVAVALLQQIPSFYGAGKWSEVMIYALLVGLLVWKPTGLGKARLKAIHV